jgi:hypothetical protein
VNNRIDFPLRDLFKVLLENVLDPVLVKIQLYVVLIIDEVLPIFEYLTKLFLFLAFVGIKYFSIKEILLD